MYVIDQNFLIGLENIYKSKRSIHEGENNDIPLLVNDDRFRYCLPLKFNCRDEKCQSEVILKDVVIETVSSYKNKIFFLEISFIYISDYLKTKKYYFVAHW